MCTGLWGCDGRPCSSECPSLEGFWITLPARAWPARGKGAPPGARPQADLPCGGRSMARYTPCLSRVLFWFDLRLCGRPRPGGCHCRRVAATRHCHVQLCIKAPTSAAARLTGTALPICLVISVLLPANSYAVSASEKPIARGELFRLEHAEPDVVDSAVYNWLGNRQLDAAGRAYGRRRLVNRVHPRGLARA